MNDRYKYTAKSVAIISVFTACVVRAQDDERFSARFATQGRTSQSELTWSEFKLSDSILSLTNDSEPEISIDLAKCENRETQNLIRDFHLAHRRGLTIKPDELKKFGGTIVLESVQGKRVQKTYDAGSKYAQFLNRLRFEMTALQNAIQRGCTPRRRGGK